jgi:prefoldin subunit 5
MAFTVSHFHDLMRLLEQHPEWRAELRRQLLTEELLSLPAVVRELTQNVRALEEALRILTQRVDRLAEQMAHLTQRVDQLAEQMAHLTQRVDRLAEAQARTEEALQILTQRVDRLAEAQARTEEALQILTQRVDRLADVGGQLRGSDIERRYRERAHAYFDDLLADIHVSSPQELADALNRALAAGVLSRQERKDLLDADIIVRGRRWEDQADAYLAVEVSAVVDEGDVERAIRRAGLLNRVTATPTVPVVAGQAITPEAEQLARGLAAWRVLDGRVFSPQD